MSNRSLTSTLDRMMTINRAIDQAFTASQNGASRAWVPAMDVVEQREAYLVYAELPGVDLGAVELSFEQNVLTIRGTKPSGLDARQEDLRVFAAERTSGTFERTMRLPEFVDGERISAELRNGVLTVTIPKAQAAQPRRIEING